MLLLDLTLGTDGSPHVRPPDYDAVVAATAADHATRLLRLTVPREQTAVPDLEAEDNCIARLIANDLVETGLSAAAAPRPNS